MLRWAVRSTSLSHGWVALGRVEPCRRACSIETTKSGWLSQFGMQTLALRKKVAELEERLRVAESKALTQSDADKAYSDKTESTADRSTEAPAARCTAEDKVADLDRLENDFEQFRQVIQTSRS